MGQKLGSWGIGVRVWLALVVLFSAAPLIIVAIASFNSVPYNEFPPEAFSVRWYVHALSMTPFRRAFANSLVVGMITAALSVAVGTAASIALVRYRFRATEGIRALLISPIVVPKISLGVALLFLFARVPGMYGSLFSLVLAHLVVCLPYALSVISAALVNADISLDEAAADLGARGIQVFRHGTLPQIATAMVVAAGFSFIISFDQVETSLFLVRPENNTLPIEMFLYLERWQDPTIAALSTMLIVLIVGGIGIVWLFLRRGAQFGMGKLGQQLE